MKKKSFLSILLFVFLFSTLLTACGSKKDGEQVNQENQENEEKSVVDEKESIVDGGSIIVGITNDLDSLDPHKAVAAGTKEVLFNIFEGLVKPNSDGELVTAVASDYEISEDGMNYIFTLRDGVKFHNDKIVTVDDVIYSIKRCAGLLEEQDPTVAKIKALSIISEVKALDDKKVEVILSEPSTELIGYFTFAIVPEDYKEQGSAPVGTGPFKFVSYEALGKVVIEKNPNYYIAGLPHLDKVTFKICADTDSAFMELLAGSIDIFPYLTESQASQLNNDKYKIMEGTTNLVQALFLNNDVEPFNNALVRKAMCHAIDRRGILDFVAGGRGTLIGSNMFPNFKKYFNDEVVDQYTYNVEEAKRLLSEAGYPDGFTFTITVPSNYQFHVDTAQVIVEQLKQVGITAKIQLVEWANWLDEVYKGRNYEATIIGLDSELVPSDILRRYNSDASNNFVNYENTEFDKTYQQAIQTTNEDEKVKYYKKLQLILAEDAASVYIQDPAGLVAVSKKISGYKFYPVYVQDMSLIYYNKEAENH